VTFLQSESQSDEMALWAFDVATRTSRVLVRAKDAVASDRSLSREEELRRERQRQRIRGVSAYAWAKHAPVVVLPLGGDVFVRDGEGPLTRLTDTPEPELDPKLCDSGARVAFVRRRELAMVEVASKRATELTKGAPAGVTRGQSDFNGQEEFDEPSGFWWSPGCDRLAYLEVDERKVAEVPVLGHRDGKPDFMMQRYPLAGTTNPAVRAGVLDVASRRTTWITLPGEGERYLARFRFAPDGRSLYLQTLSRDQKRLALVRADVATGKATELVVETSPTWIELGDARPLERSPRVVWMTQAGGHEHLELRDAATGARLGAITSGDWDVEQIVAVDEERGRVLFTGTKDGPLERQLYRAPLDGKGPIERVTSEPGVHAPVADARGRLVADVHSALARMPKAVVRSDAGEVLGELPTPADPDLEALRLRAPELVTVPGPGGVALHAAMLRPRVVEPGKRYPAVVMVYGGPGVQMVQDRWSARLLWQHLADRGFVVFQLDNRGTAGRGHAFAEALYGRLGELELADQLAGLDWLEAQPFVEKERVGMYGASYGGFMTVLAMLKAPGRFKVGVAAAPVTDFRMYDSGYTERYMGLPAQNAAGYDGTDLGRLAPALAGKLLLVHALLDENVHFDNTSHLVDALVAADKRFDLLVFPGERHGWRSPAARRYALERVVGYFAENL
jgi:dipeptidyl-peptidase-4